MLFQAKYSLSACLTPYQVFIAYCAGNIVGPQLFFAEETPVYESGFLALIICFAVGIMACVVLRVRMIMKNRSRDRSGTGLEETETDAAVHAAEDRTDKEMPRFRYVY